MQCWFALLLAPCLVGWLPVHAGSQGPDASPHWTARSSPSWGPGCAPAVNDRPARLVHWSAWWNGPERSWRRFSRSRPPAPRHPLLLVFDDPRELDLVVRTEFIVTELRERGTACSFVADEGQVIALALGGSDPLTIQQDLKSSVLDQYLLPRFGTLVPPWLQEGLAQYVGALHLVDGTLVQGEPPVGFPTLLREALETDELLDFDVLFELDAESWERRKRAGKTG